MCRMGGKWQYASPVTAKEDQDKAVLAIYIAAKDILATLHY